MLVISRRIGESFLIGEDIEATVIDITGDKVVLGISAPKTIPIQRCDEMLPHSTKRRSGPRSRGETGTPPLR
ncbi:carbon storage regulator [Ruminococcaceae bacterium OttesenSCG-928-L11]|nr:carbon storage regulator [Ruminococcaceae bacterium OttesenSCG-928-L11]